MNPTNQIQSILNSKTQIPSCHHLIERKEVHLLCHQRKSLNLVCAPTGYGKTSFVSQSVSKINNDVIWFTIDKKDNDPNRFMAYLLAACEVLESETITSLLNTYLNISPPHMEWGMNSFINVLETSNTLLTIVLDDFHIINNQTIIESIQQFISYLPEPVQLILISHNTPTLPLALLKAKNQLLEVTETELRFSDIEVKQYFELNHLEVSETNIKKINEYSKGWITAIQLMRLSYLSSNNWDDVLNDLENSDTMYSYLLETVFNNLSNDTRIILIITGLFDQITSDLCRCLLKDIKDLDSNGINNSISIILNQGLFLSSNDSHNRSYQYHPLFQSFLNNQANKLIENIDSDYTSIESVYDKGSKWFESNHMEIASLQYAMQAKNYERTIQLVQAGTIPLLYRGGAAITLTWLESMPEVILKQQPVLLLLYASASLHLGKASGLDDKMIHAEDLLTALKKQDSTISYLEMDVQIAVVRATLAVAVRDVPRVVEQSEKALNLIKEPMVSLKCAATWTRGYGYILEKEYDLAEKYLEESLNISIQIHHQLVQFLSQMSLGYIKEQTLDFISATHLYQSVVDNPSHLGYPVSCDAYLGLTRILIRKNKLKEATAHLLLAKKLAKQVDISDRLEICDLLHIEIEMLSADPQDIQFLLEQVASKIRLSKKYHLMVILDDLQYRLFLQNQKMAALKSIQLLYSNSLHPVYYELLNKNVFKAIHLLEKTYSLTKYQAIEKQLLEAYTFHLQHNKKHVYLHLEKVLIECMDTTYIQILLQFNVYFNGWLENEIANLLFLIRYPSFKSLLNQAFKSTPFRPSKIRLEDALLIEALTPRELEVLTLIGKGFSNEEICKQLFVAISTVKGTNQRIFSKLHVKRRTEAVLRAQALGLLSSNTRSMSI